MNVVKLSKSQVSLFKSWEAEYRTQLGAIQGALNENLNLKLERIAEELGIDITDGRWTFDAKAFAFTKLEEPVSEIPGRKAGRPKREDKVLEAEVVK